MNINLEIKEHFDRAARSYERHAEFAHESYESLLERIRERTHQIVDEALEQRTPDALKALRRVLEHRTVDEDEVYDLLHALLWAPADAKTVEHADDLRARLLDVARDDLRLNDAAEAQAERESEVRS